MVYGIICAMPQEFGVLEKEIKEKSSQTLFGREFMSGKIGETDVVAVVSRIGKVAAAVTTALLIDRFKVDCVVFCGIAGGLLDGIKIGDIVVGTGCVQHDFYLSDNDIFRIPLLNISNIPCDESLSEKCKAAAVKFAQKSREDSEICAFYDSIGIELPKVYSGIIASGDQFISSGERKNWIRQNVKGVACVEMEGAAVAQACFEANVPCAVIRVISDGADADADLNFDKFVDAASLFSKGILTELLK